MASRPSQFLTTRRDEALEALSNGDTLEVAANRLAISIEHASHLSRRLGLPPRKSGPKLLSEPKKRTQALMRYVVKMRELGLMYEEIGESCDPPITRERVRQLLHMAKRPDLIGHFVEASKTRNSEKRRYLRDTILCKNACGKTIEKLPTSPRKYCSHKCAMSDFRKRLNENGPRMLIMRRAGKKWREIAKEFGYDENNLGSVVGAFKHWLARADIDASDVFQPRPRKAKP